MMKNPALTMNTAIFRTRDWLLHSGIQHTKGPERGGFNAWYDLEEKQYSYMYSEITGYGITTLISLSRFFEGDDRKLPMASEWLVRRALHECGGVRTRLYLSHVTGSDSYGFDIENMFAFDNGMVLYGILNLYREQQDEKEWQFAMTLANFLLKKMRRDDGLFFSNYNPQTGEQKRAGEKWSRQSGSYHAKLALGFTELYDLTGDKKYKEVVLALGEKALTFQDPSGRFITSAHDGATHLHPHCYSAEGLLYAGLYFDREDFVAGARKAVEWALSHQRGEGWIPKMFFPEQGFLEWYRTDILAQVLRLGVILQAIGQLEKSLSCRLSLLRDALLRCQHSSEDEQDGGFLFGHTLDGARMNHVNSWCSMFAVQALIMYESYFLKGDRPKRLELFV